MKKTLLMKLWRMHMKDGMSFRQLEPVAGLKDATIRYHFKKAGLTIRPQREAVQLAAQQGRGGCVNLVRQKGEFAHNWQGGRRIDERGYVMILMRDHPRAQKNGYVAEHHLVWEEHNGPLPDEWHVQHVNGVKSDNRIENLRGMPAKDHMRYIAMQQGKIRELEAEVSRLKERLQEVEGRR